MSGAARSIAVLDYGMGNLHSVSRAIAKVGGNAVVTRDPGEVVDADALVIPGVGAFGACVRALTEQGLDRAIHGFVDTGRPVFGVCLGMQVLFKESDEDPEEGLSIVPGRSRKLPDGRQGAAHGMEHGRVGGRTPVRRRDPRAARASTSSTRTHPT